MDFDLLVPLNTENNDIYNKQLADPVAILTHNELADRKIWITDVNDVLIDNITRWFLVWAKEDAGKPVEDRKPIRVYIYSYGGDLEVCLHLLSLFKVCKTPIYTYALGVAYSAGAFLFLAGDKRYIMPGSWILIHQGKGGSDGTFDEVQAQSAHYKREIQQLKEFSLERMDIPKQTFTKKWAKEWFLTVDEALQYKVATDLIEDLSEVV